MYPNHSGQVDITHGLVGPIVSTGAVDPAVASAMQAVMSTPAFHQLVHQHRTGQGPALMPIHMAPAAAAAQAPAAPANANPAGSYGGPGAAYGGSPYVKERELRDIREFSLGFKQTNILAFGTFNVTSRPQVIFRGERMVIPDSPAGGIGSPMITDEFDVLDLKVGNRSQLVEATSLPARAFAENAVGVRLALDTASIAQDVVIQVQEQLGASATFKAVIFGTAAQ
jgi:hypothetical protein